MSKFLKRPLRLLVLGFALVVLLVSGQKMLQAQPTAPAAPASMQPQMGLSLFPAQLPPLPYPTNALEPSIDAETMELHHDRHHASYVNNLNTALEKYPELRQTTVETLLQNLNRVPEDIRTAVRNNGGGHYNHTMFWQIMSPEGGGEPTGALAEAINQTFGSFDAFKNQFNEAGTGRFGSGWAWLVANPDGTLAITSTPNQDSPIMEGDYPLMGNDVWEHAYYLSYRNRRAEYLDAWWNVVNWPEVSRRYQIAQEWSQRR
jgi:superoxide dismutase, Fe-Mn family